MHLLDELGESSVLDIVQCDMAMAINDSLCVIEIGNCCGPNRRGSLSRLKKICRRLPLFQQVGPAKPFVLGSARACSKRFH